MKLGEMPLADAAITAAGNWRKFRCYWWHGERDLDDADQWFITYTRHRDSGLLDQSNAGVIEEELKPFTEGHDPDVRPERHDHWLCGWLDGFSIRVYDRYGEITEAFREFHELAERLAEDTMLDEVDYNLREFEATLDNIERISWRLQREYELSGAWRSDVRDWLRFNDPAAVENIDDRGGCPSEIQIQRAFDGLNFRLITLN